MAYHYLDYTQLHAFCSAAFRSYGFDEKQSGEITDILLAADLNGIESHGVQRMVRYDYEIACGMVDMNAEPKIVHETPVSAVIDACNCMGQVVSRQIGIHPILTLVSIYIGLRFFGFVGVVLAPIAMVLLVNLYVSYKENSANNHFENVYK